MMNDILKAKRALVLAAHPDDETIGLGGTIKKLAKNGCIVHVVFYTGGREGFADPGLKSMIEKMRKEEIEKVQNVLDFESYEFLGYEDMAVPDDKEAFKRTIELIRTIKPDVIFTHYNKDKHRDHRVISNLSKEAWWQAGESVCTDLGRPWRAGQLYEYEILDLFQPTHIVDISEEYEDIGRSMQIYSSQLEVLPDILQKIEAIAKLRGAEIGAEYGEGFIRSFYLPERLDV